MLHGPAGSCRVTDVDITDLNLRIRTTHSAKRMVRTIENHNASVPARGAPWNGYRGDGVPADFGLTYRLKTWW